MNRRAPSRLRAFTLVEIMIVVLIVGVLSTLAIFVIGRIKDRAARSIIENNLRQLYQAKEFAYAQSGSRELRTVTGLVTDGYLKRSTGEELRSAHSIVGRSGWHYSFFVWPDQPVYAYQGTDIAAPQVADRANPAWKTPTGEVIWYPGPPTGEAPATATATAQTAPAGPPPGAPVLTNPSQPAALQLPTQHEMWYSDSNWAQVLGIKSPDGSPLTVVRITSDPPDFVRVEGRQGAAFPVTFTRPGVAGTATLSVTFRNSAGEATYPLRIRTGP